ncbi:hypothetical protein V6N11_031396 [Hibiscus sabdariffa]|uniref:Uncharacterized protein n=1 Tax=Hibiscus sabdariffa TaxID=183260 RepID=A0ABR2SXT9_9ROSI
MFQFPSFPSDPTRTSAQSKTYVCPYPCLPPPIAFNCPPPPMPQGPPLPPPFPPFLPPFPLTPPYPQMYTPAPPPPNPIWPYFPWYYKNPPPPPDYSSAMPLQVFSYIMSTSTISLPLFSFFF